MGECEGAEENWAGPRGSGVGITGLGGVKALVDGPWIEVGCAISGSGVTSAGLWAKGRLLGYAGLGFKAEEFMVLLGWGSRSTLLLAKQVLGKLDLPFNYRFASNPDC